MRFLIDENVKLKLLHWLSQRGHDVVRVPTGIKNGKVLAQGIAESRILITHDRDFADRLRYPPSRHAGVVLLEIHPLVLEKLTASLQELILNPPAEGFTGKLILLQEKGFHVIS